MSSMANAATRSWVTRSHYYLSTNKRFGLVLGYASANEQTLAWAGQWLSNAYLAHQTRTPDTPLSRDGHKTNVF